MARSKQQSGKSSDGKHRKETKEERRIRLEKQEEARQACFKMLPLVGGLILVATIAFALYVQSVPSRKVVNLATASNRLDPEFLQMMNRPIPEKDENSPKVEKVEDSAEDPSEPENTETIEL